METRSKDLSQEAQNLGRQAKEAVKESAQELSEKAKALGTSAKQTAQAAYGAAQEKVTSGAKYTDEAIRSNPYAALGIAFACGLVFGLLIKRK